MEVKGLIQDFNRLQKCEQDLVETVDFFPIRNAIEVIDWNTVTLFFHLLFQRRPCGYIEELVQTWDKTKANKVHNDIWRLMEKSSNWEADDLGEELDP